MSYVNERVSPLPAIDTSPVIVGICVPRNIGQTLRLVVFENVVLLNPQDGCEPLVMEIPSGNGSFAELE